MKLNMLPAILGAITIAATGCSKSSETAATDAGTGGGGTTITSAINITGKVVGTATTARLGRFLGGTPSGKTALSGCAVKVYDLTGATAIATGTSGADGTFTVASDAMTSGKSYKVVTTCSGGKSFSAIIGADSTPAAQKTPATVDARATLIAVQIIKAVVAAIESATTGLPSSVVDAIKAVVMAPESISKIVAAVSTTIEDAIETGSMNEPSDAASASMTTAVETTTTSNASTTLETAESAYENDGEAGANTIPISVESAVSGAAASVAAFPGCDASLGADVASAAKCTKAVAKLMYNVLHFPVGILKTGGAFGTINCVATDAALLADFPKANIIDGSNLAGDLGNFASNFCIIMSNFESTDRNKSYSDTNGGGGDKGALFTETGGGITSGVLTAMGTALYGNYKYRLSNIDQVVFGYNATTGGMNTKLVYEEIENTWPQPGMGGGGDYSYRTSTYYTLSTSNGVTTATEAQLGTCNSSPCRGIEDAVRALNLTGLGWDSGSSTPLATALGASSWTGSIFEARYGGPIPAAAVMEEQMVNERAHSPHGNRTGEPKFFVLYSKAPNWNNPLCQYGSSTTTWTDPNTSTTYTECSAQDGTLSPAVTVDVKVGAPNQTTGMSEISQIITNSAGTGKFYLIPMYAGSNGFSGLVQLINASNGRMMTDERFRPRWVKVILDATTECGNNGLPTSGNGCADGAMYNVQAEWSCNSQPCSLSFSSVGSKINSSSPTGAYTMAVERRVKMNWATQGPGRVAVGQGHDQSSWENLIVTVGSDGAISSASKGTTLSTNQYFVSQHWVCPQEGAGQQCTPGDYYLVNDQGAPLIINSGLHADLSYFTGNPPCWNSGESQVDCTKVVKYTKAYFDGRGSIYPPQSGTGGNVSFNSSATTIEVYSGPAMNPNYDCSADPFFDDADDDGELDKTVASDGTVTCSETTFSGPWRVGEYIYGSQHQGPGAIAAHPNAKIRTNDNIYKYGDPKAITSLLNTAFGAWLDGSHSLSSTTDLNALQAFALLFLFMEDKGGGDSALYVDGILPNDSSGQPRNRFQMVSPLFGGDGGSIDGLNSAIANGFLNYRQQ